MAPAPAAAAAPAGAAPPVLRHFKWSDWECKCGCGQNLTKPKHALRIDELRERCGFPMWITSGYRCPAYNAKVSTTGEDGPHTTGEATDLGVSRFQAYKVLEHGLALGFTGIGVQQKGKARFIHLDDLHEPEHAPRPTIWSY